MKDEEQERIEAIGEQLRAKINSKFQTSTFLAGFTFTILGIQITALGQWQAATIPLLLYISIALLVGATILYITAIVRLDELTMPKRFWTEDSNLNNQQQSKFAYLTDNDLWAIKNRMVFYWEHLTLNATYITATSLILMLLPPPLAELPTRTCNTLARWLIFMGMAILWLGTGVYIKRLDEQAQKKFPCLKRPKD